MDSKAPDVPALALHTEETLDQGIPSRWVILLGVPFIVGGALYGAAIYTGQMWLLGPASVFGPGAMILGFTYLGLSSDTNRFQ
jgi:hypothetical protein